MRLLSTSLSLLFFAVVAAAQQPPPAAPPPVANVGPAATVNGEPIPEATVARALRTAPEEMKAKARKEIVAFLVDNLVLDQFVRAQGPTPADELEKRMKLIKEESAKNNLPFDKLLTQLSLTEEELKAQVAADLRWERYCKAQLPDAKLEEFFKANRDHFDGSLVSGRHILISVTPEAGTTGRQQARTKLLGLKKVIESAGAADAAKKMPAGADPLSQNGIRMQSMADAFAAVAQKESDCPSKARGGDLGHFPRVGKMVEPFAKAAFALPPGQVSDVVETEFGCHLIMTTAKVPGKEVTFAEVKDMVFESCSDRLRQELLPGLRSKAQIKIAQ